MINLKELTHLELLELRSQVNSAIDDVWYLTEVNEVAKEFIKKHYG